VPLARSGKLTRTLGGEGESHNPAVAALAAALGSIGLLRMPLPKKRRGLAADPAAGQLRAAPAPDEA